MAELFRRVARPLAAPGLPGCFYRGQRLVSLDGTTLDLPDTPELEARFGRPTASRGNRAFPQMRLLALAETGTHAVFAAAFDRYDTGETTLARRLLDHLCPGMLCLADRGFVGFDLWQAAQATGADLLWRLRANQVLPCDAVLADGSYLSHLYASPAHRRRRQGGLAVRVIEYRLDGIAGSEPLYRLITTRLNANTAPAGELAAVYHERWEAEGIFAEVKVTLPGRRLMLRSRRADLAEQEVFGLLLVHFALRHLMVQAAQAVGGDPDMLSFIHAVRVVRRHLPLHAAFSPSPAGRDAGDRAGRDPRRAGRAKPKAPQPARRQAQDEQFPEPQPCAIRRRDQVPL